MSHKRSIMIFRAGLSKSKPQYILIRMSPIVCNFFPRTYSQQLDGTIFLFHRNLKRFCKKRGGKLYVEQRSIF